MSMLMVAMSYVPTTYSSMGTPTCFMTGNPLMAALQRNLDTAIKVLGIDGVGECWADQLCRAGSEELEETADTNNEILCYLQNFSSPQEMNGNLTALVSEASQECNPSRRRRLGASPVPHRTFVHTIPGELLYNPTQFVYMGAAPNGVEALSHVGVEAVEDLIIQRLSLEQVLLTCHASAWQRPSEPSPAAWRGYCHSPPTSATVWATRTATTDGRVIPLLWACHQKEHALGASRAFECHVLEKSLVALSPDKEFLLRAD